MMLASQAPNAAASPAEKLTVAKKSFNDTSGKFVPLDSDIQAFSKMQDDRIVVSGLNQFDGQYVILVNK